MSTSKKGSSSSTTTSKSSSSSSSSGSSSSNINISYSNASNGEGQEEVSNISRKRQDLRKAYRTLFLSFQNQEGELYGNRTLNEFREQVNLYFNQVEHIREMQLDAESVNLVARALYERSKKLKDISKQYAIDDFIVSMKNVYQTNSQRGSESLADSNSGAFNWALLGEHVMASVFDDVYAIETMIGPINREIKVRLKRPRVDWDDADKDKGKFKGLESAVIITGNEEGDKDEESNKRVQYLHTNLQSLTQEVSLSNSLTQSSSSSSKSSTDSQIQAVDVCKFLVDRADCIQTIENLFDFSFLLKEKKAVLGIDSNTQMPTTLACTEDQFVDSPNNQLVMTVDMKKLRRINELLSKLDAMEQSSASKTNTPASKKGKTSSVADDIPDPASLIKYPSLHREDEIYSRDIAASRRKSIGSNPVSALPKKGPASNTNTNNNSSSNITSNNNNNNNSSSSSSSSTIAKPSVGNKRKA